MYRIDYAVGAESKRSHILTYNLADTIQFLKECGCVVLSYLKF